MNGKKIVQFVKTFDGALWAVQQVKMLKELGWDIHVVCPSLKGRYSDAWKETGAVLHALPCEFPATAPWKLSSIKNNLVSFINELKPDLIHSHFVSTTLMLRYALHGSSIPRIFQVPGPLHLEHSLFGQWETAWADNNDYWIASSRYIKTIYESLYAIPQSKVFLSYYGTDVKDLTNERCLSFRKANAIPGSAIVFGNVSFIYPPKFYLGQTVGLKGHELMIDALAEVMQQREDVWGVFIGQQWGKSQNYFEKIKNAAKKKSSRFIFTGYLPHQDILSIWKEFDFALHLPSSENCGGVIEPMLNGTLTFASNVGGLPEVVIPGKTGILTERNVPAIVNEINAVLEQPELVRELARNGQKLVSEMFDVNRTSREISQIYSQILGQRTTLQGNNQ